MDWIIEAVVENLDIKRALLKKVEAIRKPGTIVTTNTSGLPVAKIAEGFSDDFRRSWFGTHFFNPPRYMRLLEMIPTPETDRAAMEAIAHFCDVHLGKGVVYRQRHAELHRQSHRHFFGAERHAPDAGDGPDHRRSGRPHRQAVGWPKSATFRTIDLVGLDILGHVVGNMAQAKSRMSAAKCQLPEFFKQMLRAASGWATRPKGGFYKKAKDPRQGRRATRPGLEDAGIPSAPEAEICCSRHGEERRRYRSARLRMLLGLEARPAEGRQGRSVLCGRLSPICGPTPLTACLKFPTPSSKSIAP